MPWMSRRVWVMEPVASARGLRLSQRDVLRMTRNERRLQFHTNRLHLLTRGDCMSIHIPHVNTPTLRVLCFDGLSSVTRESHPTTTETLRLVTSISVHTRRPGPATPRAYPLPESRHRPCTCGWGEENHRSVVPRGRRGVWSVGTHRMRSAWRVKFPNLCEEKTMVLFPRRARSLSNKSGQGVSGPMGRSRRDQA